MKAPLTYATLALLLGTPAAFSKPKSEVETLRDLCSTQKEQIQKLSQENTRLKGSKESTKTVSDSDDKPKSGTYTVKSGDTLERIARKLDCSAATLGKSNKITTETVLHPGQVLKVPGAAKSEPSSEAPRIVDKPASHNSDKTASSSKKEKDSEKTASDTRKEKKAEPKEEKEKLASNKPEPKSEPKPLASSSSASSSSDSKMISNPKPAAPAPKQPEATAEASKAPATTGGGAKSGVRSVIIQDETSYGTFASAHGTTSDRLNDLNGLSLSNNTVLAKGSELYIPAQP